MDEMADSENHNNTNEKHPLERVNTDVNEPRRRCTYYHHQKKYLVILAIIIFTLAGFLFGYFIRREKLSHQKQSTTPHDAYMEMVDPKRLEENLR